MPILLIYRPYAWVAVTVALSLVILIASVIAWFRRRPPR
jgi:hypothetical protein